MMTVLRKKKQVDIWKNVLMIYGKDFKGITRKVLEEADLKSRIPSRKSRIGIKPNLVSPSEASWGATTHPEVVAGIIEYLQESGFENLVMLEGSWVGDRTGEAVEVCGYDRLSKTYGVPFLDMQKDTSSLKMCGGMELKICDQVEALDFLINVPVMKGHCQTKITCALKNMKGLIPNSEKRHFHAMGLHAPIAHLALGIHQDFVVVDNICGDWDFEDGGNPVVMNRVMAAVDPVLTDAWWSSDGICGRRGSLYYHGAGTWRRMCRLEEGKGTGAEPTRRRGGCSEKQKNCGTSGCSGRSGVLQRLLWILDPGAGSSERGRVIF